MKRRLAVAVLMVVCTLAGLGAAARADVLSSDDKRHYRAAFESVQRGAWGQAGRFAAEAKDPLPRKVLRWLELLDGGSGASFDEITAFIAANPDWPRLTILARRAEEAMSDATPTKTVLAWFDAHKPQGSAGMTRLIAALYQTNRMAEADALVRRAWIEGTFGPKEEKEFLARYGRQITQADHWARLDRLLWDGKHDQAKSLLRRVDVGHQALAQARIHLRQGDSSIDWAIRRVPKALLEDPGFQYERARWRRKKNRDNEASAILAHPPAVLVRADLWWDERSIVARRRLADGSITDAYRLAKEHGPIDGGKLVQAEWFAGWVALRFLNEPLVALEHFKNTYEAATIPGSQSRAAYWAGRAAEAIGNAAAVKAWYGRAAQHDWTFYGQLAASRSGNWPAQPLPAEPNPTDADVAVFEGRELTRIVRAMAEIGRNDLVKAFILQLGQRAKSPAERVLAGRLAIAYDRRDVGVLVARDAGRDGLPLPVLAYPVIALPAGGPEPALLHAVMRQESNFQVSAESIAGARGLMQLIPATARAVSRLLNLGYSPERLASDGHYNIRLGQAYLADLIGKYDGSYVLALAAYNAGPGSVQRWLRQNGDPRRKGVDIVDWIEQIPYDETRSYVQHVIENLQVYRRRIDGAGRGSTIEADFRRGASPKG